MSLKPRPLRKLDERLGFASTARSALGKIFPDHWSFMLGEIALYSFVLLVVTGTYLALFYEPSSTPRLYDGSYAPIKGQFVSGAFASSVELSYDVRGGLLIRQAHHWLAHIFIGSIVLHLCRIYFTAMFRKPRELNWTVGLTLLVLAIFNAFAGYSLPDDLLSGTGLRIFASTIEAVPIVGGWLLLLVFGGEYPGDAILPRLLTMHVFVVPAAIGLLLAVHMGILIRQKHSQFPGPGRRDANVVGSRVWPAYALRSLSLLFAVTAVAALLGGLVQINPVWVWGEYEPWTIMSPSVADWYILWVEGALRLFPPVEFRVGDFLVPNQFWPAVFMPSVLFGALYLWPWIDRWITGDRAAHHIAARPRESPVRVACGVFALTFLVVLLLAGAEEVYAGWTDWTINTVRIILRTAVLVLPPVAAAVAYRLAAALRGTDRSSLLALGGSDLIAPPSEPGADLDPGLNPGLEPELERGLERDEERQDA